MHPPMEVSWPSRQAGAAIVLVGLLGLPAVARQQQAAAAANSGPVKSAAARPAPAGKSQTPAASSAGTASALQFLGTYSAPQAIEATETGHTSAPPPGPGAEARLAELEARGSAATAAPRALSPGSAARARLALAGIGRLMAAPKTPEQWFAIGSTALDLARASSRALAAAAPHSVWNQSLQRAALEAAEHPSLLQATASAPGDPAAAWRTLEAVGARPSSPALLYRQALAALALGDSAWARASAVPALAARIDGMRALAAEQGGDTARAARLYRAGLALAPADAALHASLGELAREQRQYQAAAVELRIARRLDTRDPVIAFELGDVEFRLGHPRAALPLLNQAVAQAPGHSGLLQVARWSRARSEAALGQYPAALADFQAAAGADRSGALQYQLYRVYRKLGRKAEAAAALRRSQAQRAAARRQAAQRLR